MTRIVGTAGKTLLVAVTVLCLLSIGGAMLFAAPLLVPLHWLAARDGGPYKVGAWAVLAAASVFEYGWMAIYAVTENGGLGLTVGAVAALLTGWLFLRAGAERAVRRAAVA